MAKTECMPRAVAQLDGTHLGLSFAPALCKLSLPPHITIKNE
jgi:hypothetical protein